jgi:hypothetical protein
MSKLLDLKEVKDVSAIYNNTHVLKKDRRGVTMPAGRYK